MHMCKLCVLPFYICPCVWYAVQEFLEKSNTKFGTNQNRGQRKELAQAEFPDLYDRFVQQGIFKEHIVDGQVYVSRHEVLVGEVDAAKTGCRLTKSKKATRDEFAAVENVMKHLKFSLQLKPNHAHLSGEDLPDYVWEKVSVAIDYLKKQEMSVVAVVGKDGTGAPLCVVHVSQLHILTLTFTYTYTS